MAGWPSLCIPLLPIKFSMPFFPFRFPFPYSCPTGSLPNHQPIRPSPPEVVESTASIRPRHHATPITVWRSSIGCIWAFTPVGIQELSNWGCSFSGSWRSPPCLFSGPTTTERFGDFFSRRIIILGLASSLFLSELSARLSHNPLIRGITRMTQYWRCHCLHKPHIDQSFHLVYFRDIGCLNIQAGWIQA